MKFETGTRKQEYEFEGFQVSSSLIDRISILKSSQLYNDINYNGH